MHYAVARVCSDCPFRRTDGVRLMRERVCDIVDGVLGEPGTTFACHKTTGVLGNRRHDQHCAGALIFAERHNHATQMTRIAERLGFYDRAALLATPDASDVFASTRAMLATAFDRTRAGTKEKAPGAKAPSAPGEPQRAARKPPRLRRGPRQAGRRR